MDICHCVVAPLQSVFVLLCCPTFFCVLSNPFLIGNCHVIVVCTMSCVCVGFVGVCCVMSSDGVRGVDDAACLAVHSQKQAAQHTVLFACDGVHQCVVLFGVVGGCKGFLKKGRGKDTVKQKTKQHFSQNHFFPFFLFSTFFPHSFLLAFHSSIITPFLSKYSPVFHASHMSAFMVNKNTNDTTTVSFHRLFFLSKHPFFSSFPSADG